MASGVQPRLGWWFRTWSFNVFHCPVSKFKWDGEIKCFGLLSAVLTTSQLFRFLIISCLMSFWDSGGLLPPGACSQWTCATWPCDATDFHQPPPSADFQQLPWPRAVILDVSEEIRRATRQSHGAGSFGSFGSFRCRRWPNKGRFHFHAFPVSEQLLFIASHVFPRWFLTFW